MTTILLYLADSLGSLHTDFQEMAKEIRQRGERMTQQVEIALNNE